METFHVTCRYNPAARTTAAEALLDTWFTTEPLPATEFEVAALLQKALQSSDTSKTSKGFHQNNDGGHGSDDQDANSGGFDGRQAPMSDGSSDSLDERGSQITTMPGWR